MTIFICGPEWPEEFDYPPRSDDYLRPKSVWLSMLNGVIRDPFHLEYYEIE